MELSNEFTVDVPVDEAWNVLTDVSRIAPCMPGAQLKSVEGDEYHGVVKVKVGPVTAEYKGKAVFLERDEAAHRAVLRAEGRETRGQGNASATITAQLEPAGSSTRVSVTTDLAISGRVAQFGRGVLADVSTKLLGQFVDSLESTVLGGAQSAAPSSAGSKGEGSAGETATAANNGSAGGTATGENGHRVPSETGAAEAPAAAPVDLVRVVGPVVLKRAAGGLAAFLAVLFVWRLLRRRGR